MNAARIVLIGAGGLARETAAAVRSVPGGEPTLLGYLDDSPALAGASVGGLPVLGPTTTAAQLPGEPLFLATVASSRDPGRRRRVVERVALPPERWGRVVHPCAHLSACTVVGAGSIVLAACVATADVRIGHHVALMPGVILTHDDVLEDYVTIASGVCLSGGVRVRAEAYIGTGALVREGLTIGRGAVVGMGAVVTKDVPDGQTWVGVPARRVDPGR